MVVKVCQWYLHLHVRRVYLFFGSLLCIYYYYFLFVLLLLQTLLWTVFKLNLNVSPFWASSVCRHGHAALSAACWYHNFHFSCPLCSGAWCAEPAG
ncbi:hypothetical protein TRSC58_07236 [Trypanosoma rangeli SC58]|uniref:Uncharacterized protein n=1 Tax=Trypanosoma rangeli SC58 TaxID=429131 RepID=A0A061IT85_TRYRA|nr:hypothetical protein TRSC58_07236 [Trypanosoma rangeli SC58]